MKSFSVTYHKFLHWLFTFSILFGLGGYSNYTSPKSKDHTTEQLADVHKHSKKTAFYKKQLLKYWNFDILKNNKSLILLKDHHSRRTLTIAKKQSFTVILSEKNYIALIHTNSYSEEDSFHYTLG